MLSAKAGTPIADIEALMASADRRLDLRADRVRVACSAGRAAPGTIGGAIAADLSGPRRHEAGAAHDHFLGVSARSGRGETFKSGGRWSRTSPAATVQAPCRLMRHARRRDGCHHRSAPEARTAATILVH